MGYFFLVMRYQIFAETESPFKTKHWQFHICWTCSKKILHISKVTSFFRTGSFWWMHTLKERVFGTTFPSKKKRFCQPPYPGKLFVWVSRSLAPGDQRQPQGNMTLGGSDGDFHVLYSIFLLGKSQTGNQLQIHNRVSQRVSAIIYIYI